MYRAIRTTHCTETCEECGKATNRYQIVQLRDRRVTRCYECAKEIEDAHCRGLRNEILLKTR